MTMTATTTRAEPGAPITRAELARHASEGVRRSGASADDMMAEIDLAVHEAGHAVAAVMYGGRIRSAVLTASGGIAGLSGLTTMAGDVPAGRTAEIAYAGPWSQAAWLAGRRPNSTELRALLAGGGCRDDGMLRRELGFGTGGTGSAVEPLLERAWPAVLTLAGKLFRTGEVGHDDVLAALGITDGGGPGSAQLANIRAGLRRPVAATT